MTTRIFHLIRRPTKAILLKLPFPKTFSLARIDTDRIGDCGVVAIQLKRRIGV